MGVFNLDDQSPGLPFGVTYAQGYVKSNELERVLKTHGGSVSCRVVVTSTGDPAWMFFYVHPTGVHLDVIATRLAGPKLYWRGDSALKFLTKHKPFFTVTDNPYASIPPLDSKPILPGDLLASSDAFSVFRDTFFGAA